MPASAFPLSVQINVIEHSVNTVKEMGYIESGDTVIVTVGVKHKNQPSYAIGETNNMRVIVVN